MSLPMDEQQYFKGQARLAYILRSRVSKNSVKILRRTWENQTKLEIFYKKMDVGLRGKLLESVSFVSHHISNAMCIGNTAVGFIEVAL